jgi:hypothetical protein
MYRKRKLSISWIQNEFWGLAWQAAVYLFPVRWVPTFSFSMLGELVMERIRQKHFGDI